VWIWLDFTDKKCIKSFIFEDFLFRRILFWLPGREVSKSSKMSTADTSILSSANAPGEKKGMAIGAREASAAISSASPPGRSNIHAVTCVQQLFDGNTVTFRMPFEDLTRVRAVFIWMSTGSKIIGQYYDDYITEPNRAAFETGLIERVREETKGEILEYKECIVVFKSINDTLVILVGDAKINELIFAQLLQSLEAAIGLVFRTPGAAAFLLQRENVYLLLDETIDQGFVMEGNSEVIAARVLLKEDNAFSGKAPLPSAF
jgi:hypothetical protein